MGDDPRKAEIQRDAAVSARREAGVSERQQQSISAERLAEMREAVLRYGPSNCWTGTTGTLAAMVFELLRAIGEERGT